MTDKHTIIDILKKISSPGEKTDLVSSGQVKQVEINNMELYIEIELAEKQMKYKAGVEATINDVIKKQVSDEFDLKIKIKQEYIDPANQIGGVGKVKNIIAVASGKGGVGKSTITTNLAVSLANNGYKVGLIDADIFGPSIPKMFGTEGVTPYARKEGEKDLVIPIEKYGVKMLSIGFFVKPSDAVAWRGPVASGALKQLINDGDWGELDFLLLDLPPGTSDIQLTLVQTVSITGAVIVSTPQDIALIDAVKGIDFFQKEGINVPILGLVENMAWFTPEELPDNKYYIFGEGGAEKLCTETKIPFLGHVPIVQSIREGGDNGEPVAAQDGMILQNVFADIADKALEQLTHREANLPPTKVVEVD